MDRRQFLHTLNASGIGITLPTWARANVISPSISQATLPPTIEVDQAVVEVAPAWNIPKFGIVSVGGIGGTCLPSSADLIRSLSHLCRTVAIDTHGVELHFMNANRKVPVDGRKTLLTPHAAGLLAQSVAPEIADAVAGLDMVFLVAGMGGATGTGIAPIVAQVLHDQGILTLAFAIMPFHWEGAQRQQIAQAGILELRPRVDALIPFFNIDPGENKIGWRSAAAQQASLVFKEVCRNIMNPVCSPGLVKIDWEDLRDIILSQGGECAFGFGSANFQDGAEVAAVRAVEHPLLGRSRLQRASTILVAISTSRKAFNLQESRNAFRNIHRLSSRDVWIAYGTAIDNTLGGDITVSILATG